MKRQVLSLILAMVLIAAPAQAFSIKKVGRAIKTGAAYTVAAVVVIVIIYAKSQE